MFYTFRLLYSSLEINEYMDYYLSFWSTLHLTYAALSRQYQLSSHSPSSGQLPGGQQQLNHYYKATDNKADN